MNNSSSLSPLSSRFPLKSPSDLPSTKEIQSHKARLLALDIDNTLTDYKGRLSEHAIELIRKAQTKGIYVALVSARPSQGVDEVADLIGGNIYKISYLGAVIRDSLGNELQRLTLDIEVIRDIIRFADQNKLGLMVTIKETEYHTYQDRRESMTQRIAVSSLENVLSLDALPVLIGFKHDRSPSSLYEYCLKTYGKSMYFTEHINSDNDYRFVLASHPEAQKGNALFNLCKYMCVDPFQVIAIGDSESDISMFQVAGFSVAVANAHPNVHLAAKLSTPLPYGDGVAWSLQYLLDFCD
ncbi:HAD-IIB family hydrolase [Nostoc sp. ATCC 53789]|uniref:HAD-IIB family hydrolase n=1 Tax=Nostoc sp. ATCC 53789 TaxID=76335 RepID=UPI000DEC3C41|nr:HAD-IIB family hydrolase [Nostoc sp. ATCC 53789]QHG21027.1 HAD-IIB family hydrolase [Nostoc sp. ATCC 53789]RCJ16750.1 hypothetical protein A6V25_30220 [Nostoc sp. ATCC 53789]